jgi:pimeloyl-ACP methyl ester carboxylesterase
MIKFAARMTMVVLALSFSLFGQDRNPLILIPGMTGSELRHKDTGDRIWFKTFKSKSEDLRLPVVADPTQTHDDLIATDALRSVKVGVFSVYDIYGDFIKEMETRGGYHEENWDTPSENGSKDSLYVFAYDWRLDNVGNARLLIRKVDALRARLNRPSLKFDIVGHSMGGLISRYAAMYGDADLPPHGVKPIPTWAGAKYFDKIVLLGTPNEGSVLALNALVNGYSIGNVRVDLPLVQDSSKFLVFTLPSVFELLPAPGTFKVYDERLEPVQIDIYDPKTWAKYGWSTIDDKEFPSKFNLAERKAAPAYFAAMLDRARRWHEALAATNGKTPSVAFYIVGSDCTTAPDSIVLYRDGNRWKTAFRPIGFRRSDGVRITDDEMKKIMLAPGDGIVTKRSLEAATGSQSAGVRSVVASTDDKFFCEGHNKLAANNHVQDYVIGLFKQTRATAEIQTDENEGE